MHFSKLIIAFVVMAATNALASSPIHDNGKELAEVPREAEYDALEGGISTGPGCDESEMGADNNQMENFSPVTMSSLEWGVKRICLFGPCLRRHSSRRRCPKGYRILGYRRCGWWRVRALCCRPLVTVRRGGRHWASSQVDGVEGENDEGEPAEQMLDQLDG